MSARSIALTWTLPAIPVNAQVYKKEAATLTFTAAAVTSMSAWTITFNLKQYHGDTSALLTITPTITDSTNGVFTVALTTTHTGTTMGTIQSYPFDVWRTDSGSETLLAFGLVTLLEEVR